MTEWIKQHEILYPLGVTPLEDGVKILVQAAAEQVSLLLYRHGGETPFEEIPFKEEERVGDVWAMTLKDHNLERLEYAFFADGRLFADPCARAVCGRENWGDLKRAGKPLRGRFATAPFDWEGDKRPGIPYSDSILYRLHVRGFTKHSSSKVTAKGTYRAVAEKIPYFKELGVTSVELMPITEFDEVMMSEGLAASPMAKEEPTGRINYWGYGPSYLFAVKQSYGLGKKESPEQEFKGLVKALHQAGLECVMEIYFTGKEPARLATDVLRYWVQEYHVDGFRITGRAPAAFLAEDPFLAGTKLFFENLGDVFSRRPAEGHVSYGEGPVSVREKHLALYSDGFQNDMRRFLKGDEDMVNALTFHLRNNPASHGVINYIANTNGFTMMDMVSYDRKHNELNGEDNRDGNDYCYTWNCGAEGPTRKKKVQELRRRQLRNAFLLLFLSQGTPLLLAGDEFGNSQGGNNNAYCQDNEISWLNWRNLAANREQFEFVKQVIAFRKQHGLFHMDREPRIMDYKACGRPDMSYHGENVWRPEFENFRRQLGVLYWGPYGKKADGSEDDTFYVAFNMHWEPHIFGLPRLSKGQTWHTVFDTSKEEVNGYYIEGTEPELENQDQAELPPRSILVLCGRETKKKIHRAVADN